LVEGGSELAGALVAQRLVDRVILFIAPLLIGGKEAVPAIGGEGFERLSEAPSPNQTSAEKVGQRFGPDGEGRSELSSLKRARKEREGHEVQAGGDD
jgi:dihydrofolate reductase